MSDPSITWSGAPISKPGMYARVPLDTYHGASICDGPSVSSSGLRKLFNESPAHFFAEWACNPNRTEPKTTRAMILGRAVHHLMLGEPYFAKLFCSRPETIHDPQEGKKVPWQGNRTVCRQWLRERADEGRIVILPEEIEQIKGMALKLGEHPLVRQGILNGHIERSLIWKDKKTGLWCKARPDTIPTSSGDFSDLKSTTSVVWLNLVRAIQDYSYHQQAAMIRTGAREVLGIEKKDFAFSLVFIEKDPPNCVRVVLLKEIDIDRGERANRYALDKIAECLKSKHWPGPGGDRDVAEHIELSEREQKRIDDELTIIGAG